MPSRFRVTITSIALLTGIGLATAAVALPGNSDGLPDSTFGSMGRVVHDAGSKVDEAGALAVARDGSLLIAGASENADGKPVVTIAKILPDGSPDIGFGFYGTLTLPLLAQAGQQPAAIAVQPDGAIVVAGTTFIENSADRDWFVIRLTETGARDFSFGGGYVGILFDLSSSRTDYAVDMLIDAKGRIVVFGTVSTPDGDDFAVARLLDDGSPDGSFGSFGQAHFGSGAGDTDTAAGIALSPDGHLLLAGTVQDGMVSTLVDLPSSPASGGGPTADFAGLELDDKGVPVPGYGGLGTGWSLQGFQIAGVDTHDYARDIAIRADGAAVLVGTSFVPLSANDDFSVLVLDGNGAPLGSFDGDGRKILAFDRGGSNTDEGAVVLPQCDGKVVVAGTVQVSFSSPRNQLGFVRLLPEGGLDPTFGIGGGMTLAFDEGSYAERGILWSGRATVIANGQSSVDADFEVGRVTSRLVSCDGFEGAATSPWVP
jgi:uncharacterized delta-60 repeat protein